MSNNYWDQTETWTDRGGITRKLEDLKAGHRHNILRMLRERIGIIRLEKEGELLCLGLDTNDPGELSQDASEIAIRELGDMTDDQLFESLPLVKRLREIMAHDPAFLNNIPVEVHEPGALFFREQWVNGEADGRTFSMDRTIGGQGLILDVAEGEGQPRRVESIRIEDLVRVWLDRTTTL